MKVLIHDLEKEEYERINFGNKEQYLIISDNETIKSCIGCLSCWTKTSGICVLDDSYNNMGSILGQAEEVIIISKCTYGCYSPFIKNVIDRCIPYLHPYFIIKNGQMRHKARYSSVFNCRIFFYGDAITDKEREIVKKLAEANSLNYNCNLKDVKFINNFLEIGDIL